MNRLLASNNDLLVTLMTSVCFSASFCVSMDPGRAFLLSEVPSCPADTFRGRTEARLHQNSHRGSFSESSRVVSISKWNGPAGRLRSSKLQPERLEDLLLVSRTRRTDPGGTEEHRNMKTEAEEEEF